MERAISEDVIVGAIIRKTSIVAGRESGKAAVGSIKRAPQRHASEPALARRRRRHLHRRCKGLPEMSSGGHSVSEESRTESKPYEIGE
jgi:hypothetical protein